MSRFKLYIEYEGTRYSGWQVQKNARTVQGELMGAVKSVFKTDAFEVQGAGRTDAGVHALQQVAHLDVATMLAPEIIKMKVNDELPADINLLEVAKATPHFHARRDAVARWYLYQIARRRTAFGKRSVWWIKDRLDVGKMKDSLQLFVGMNDLQSFTDDDPGEKSTTVLVEDIQVKEAGDLILVRVIGSHFIWKLVRRLIGVAVEVGRGTLTQADVKRFLGTPSAEPARYTAPPSGLFLERVLYKGDKPPTDLVPTLNLVSGQALRRAMV